MTTNLRRLGVYGDNLPVKKSKTVQASDFNIGGIIGLFERKYKVAFEANNPEEAAEIFGDHINSAYYGNDVLKGFFDNVVGVNAKVFIVSHVGYDGAAYDAVAAFDNVLDGGAANTLKIESAYKEELDYGVSGNRTGYTIENGFRFSTLVATAGLAADTSAVLDSVIGIKVGDIMKFVATGGGGATVYKKITNVDESANTVSWSGVFHATANLEVDDTAQVLGFKLKTYRKTLNGIVTEVETELGKIWCTIEPEVSDFYVENVHSQNKWIKATDLDSVSALELSFPVDVATVELLTGGDNGTSPTTVAHWSQDLLAFDNEPVRFLCNAETTDVSIQKAGETYCKGRWDNPIWIYNIASDRTKDQLLDIGHGYQRSDDVMGVIVANWIKISDPFSTSTIAPPRMIPSCGHTIGAWVRTIGIFGIHFIPAVREIPLFGIDGIVGDQFKDDIDRTEIAEAGVNLIQFIQGVGYIVRNFFTPSTETAYQFGNGILMRNFLKVSIVDSLQTSENKPNSFERIKEDKMASLQFLYRLWERGNTGNARLGETFGQSLNPDGSATNFDDHIEVQADLINNPQDKINIGERNIDIYFTYPAPAGSIKVGVGILLRS
jgi:hypothetical protein